MQIELLLRLGCHEAHGWPLHCFSSRLGIAVIVLVALEEGLHIFGWHQPGIVPKRDQLPAHMVRASAGLHADQAGRKISKAVLKLTARELRLEDDSAAFIEADQVENVLADIDADDGNLCAGLGGFAVRWHGQFLCLRLPPR